MNVNDKVIILEKNCSWIDCEFVKSTGRISIGSCVGAEGTISCIDNSFYIGELGVIFTDGKHNDWCYFKESQLQLFNNKELI